MQAFSAENDWRGRTSWLGILGFDGAIYASGGKQGSGFSLVWIGKVNQGQATILIAFIVGFRHLCSMKFLLCHGLPPGSLSRRRVTVMLARITS